MDDETTERLKRLQMEDLGTFRREHISTVDTKSFRNVRLQDIEATRMSNVAGTDAERLAKANATRLDAWASVYKKIGDTEELEQLDTLLSGQSHRLQLRAVVEESGGQSYSKSVQNKNSFFKVAEHGPKGRPTATRGSKGAGRGGGVIGTRGRDAKQISPNAQSRVSNHGAVSKLGHHVAQSPQSKKRLQDPALDINNDPQKKDQEEKVWKAQMDTRGGTKKEPTPVKARRPIPNVDFSRILSPPESFLAVARSLVGAKSPDIAATVASRVSEEVTVAGGSQAVNGRSREFIKEPGEISDGRTYKDSVASSRSEGESVAIATPVSSINGQSAQARIAQTSHTANQTSQRPEFKSLKSPQQEQSAFGVANRERRPERRTPRRLQPAARRKDYTPFIPQPEKPGEVLIDLSPTPPDKSILGEEDGLLMSSAMEDLKGITFEVEPAQVPPQEPEMQKPCVTQTETAESKDSSSLGKGDSKEDSTPIDIPTDLDAFQKKIVGFYDFVEATFRQHLPGHLRDEDLQALDKYKRELAEHLLRSEQESKETPEISEQHQDIRASHEPSVLKTEKTKETEQADILSRTLSSSSLAVSTPLKGGNGLFSLRSEGSPSPSRFNVQAKPFIPRSPHGGVQRNPSFTEYRDPKPSPSESSQSTTDHLLHSRQSSQDHIIIGSTGSTPSQSIRQSGQYMHQTSESHIIGDHLLPGRRVHQSRISEIGTPSPSSGSTEFRVKFSIPNQPQASIGVSKARLSAFESTDERELSESKSINIADAFANTKEISPKPVTSAATTPGIGANEMKSSTLWGQSAPAPVATTVVCDASPKPVALQQSMHASKPVALQQSTHASKPIALQQSVHASKPVALQQSIHASKPVALQQSMHASKPAVLQQSIHAPVTQENHTPFARKPSGSAQGGLGSSIYAASAKQKPFR